MKRFVWLTVWGGMISFLVTQPGASGTESLQWGITPKTPVQNISKPDDKSGPTERSTPMDAQQTVPRADSPPAAAGNSQPNQTAASLRDAMDPQRTSIEKQEKKKAPEKKTAVAGISQSVAKTKVVEWVDPLQKETCESYLNLMRSSFLRTRHHSIQGAPCDTASNASAFLQITEKCVRECPQGFIQQSGYTDRILRNIQYLEKLGDDRCGPAPGIGGGRGGGRP